MIFVFFNLNYTHPGRKKPLKAVPLPWGSHSAGGWTVLNQVAFCKVKNGKYTDILMGLKPPQASYIERLLRAIIGINGRARVFVKHGVRGFVLPLYAIARLHPYPFLLGVHQAAKPIWGGLYRLHVKNIFGFWTNTLCFLYKITLCLIQVLFTFGA